MMKPSFRKRPVSTFVLLSLLLLVTVFASAMVGSPGVDISFTRVIGIIISGLPGVGKMLPEYSGSHVIIIREMRLPRILLGVVAGIALSVSGTSMQGIFKNPMASPFILGVSAGAAFGAAASIVLGLGIYVLPVVAFASAMGTALLVFALGRIHGKTDVATLLLAGLAVNFLMQSLTAYLIYLSPPEKRTSIIFWMWGSFNGTIWRDFWVVLPVVVAGIFVVYVFYRELNVLQLGDESALHLGVEVEKTKLILLAASSLLAAVVVSFTGIIGFVGLIIPHATRIITGPDHKKLIPAAALTGGIFMVLCDTISRASGEIPIGIITGLFGAPFFIYLLLRSRGKTGW